MKKVVLCLLFLPLISVCQTYNFKIEDGDVIWQAIYNKTVEITEMEKQLRLTGEFDNYQISEEQIICNLDDYQVDYISQGKTYMNTPIFISQMQFRSLVVIDFKEDKYRITLSKLQSSPRMDGPLGTAGQYTFLRDFALKKKNTEFANRFLNNGAEYLNYGFNELFDYNKSTKDGDW